MQWMHLWCVSAMCSGHVDLGRPSRSAAQSPSICSDFCSGDNTTFPLTLSDLEVTFKLTSNSPTHALTGITFGIVEASGKRPIYHYLALIHWLTQLPSPSPNTHMFWGIMRILTQLYSHHPTWVSYRPDLFEIIMAGMLSAWKMSISVLGDPKGLLYIECVHVFVKSIYVHFNCNFYTFIPFLTLGYSLSFN